MRCRVAVAEEEGGCVCGSDVLCVCVCRGAQGVCGCYAVVAVAAVTVQARHGGDGARG